MLLLYCGKQSGTQVRVSIFMLCREATTSMTSVPKPLKFLRSHYKELKDLYESIPTQNRNKLALADIISVMAITSGEEGARESLEFRYIFPTSELPKSSPCCESDMHVQNHLSSLHVQYK